MRLLTTLYCSSRETDNYNQEQGYENAFRSNISPPIQVDNPHEELYLSLKSFTFTNLFYNSLPNMSLLTGVEYRNKNYSQRKQYSSAYSFREGWFDVAGFQNEYLYSLSNEAGKTISQNTFSMTSLGFVTNTTTSMPTFFNQLEYNENNRKLSFYQPSFVIRVKKDEVEIGSQCFLPIAFYVEMGDETEEIYDYWGLYRRGDLTEVGPDGKKRVLKINLPSPQEQITIHSGVEYIDYTYPDITYEFKWAVYLRPVDYIDVECSNVIPSFYSTAYQTLARTGIIARIPILNDFGESLNYMPQFETFVPINTNMLSDISLTLTNADKSIRMQKTMYLIEIGVYKQEMKDISELHEGLDSERYVPPILASNREGQDPLNYAQQQQLYPIQVRVLGNNKRSRVGR